MKDTSTIYHLPLDGFGIGFGAELWRIYLILELGKLEKTTSCFRGGQAAVHNSSSKKIEFACQPSSY